MLVYNGKAPCSGLNKNALHRSIGSGTIRTCAFVGVGLAFLEEVHNYWVGFEVSVCLLLLPSGIQM